MAESGNSEQRRPRIGLVHALHASIAPIEAAFVDSWPEAETVSLYDQSLYADFNKTRSVTPDIFRRIESLLRFSRETGAEAILFTGSLFGEPQQSTAAGTGEMMSADIQEYAAANNREYELDARYVAGAIDALLWGDREEHDELVAAAAAQMGECDALLLAQFSMAPVAKRLPPVEGRVVLTSPGSAVSKLKRLLNT